MTLAKAPHHLCIILAAIVAASMSCSVLAQFTGYYFEFSAGSTEATAEPLPSLSSRSQTAESTIRSGSYSLAAGLRFNDTFAVEVTYTDHGKFSDYSVLTDRLTVVEQDPVSGDDIFNVVDARLDGHVDYGVITYGANAIANWPLSRRWTVFGRLGLASWEADSKIKGRLVYRGDLEREWDVAGTLSDSGTSFFYGLGLLYRFNRSYGAKLEYQQSSVKSGIFNGNPELETVNFGVRYYF